MKQSLSLDGLISEVSRQSASRRDFVVPSQLVTLTDDAQALALDVGGTQLVSRINDLAHTQLAGDVGIPQKFYDRLRGELPGLAAHNVNTIMRARDAGQKRLVRVLDGNARAFLSARYRCIDNLGLIEQLMPQLVSRPDMRLASCDITERRLYIKLVSDELTGEVVPGDVVRGGLLIKNSEVGCGAWEISPFTERLICKNGAVHTQLGQRAPHIGRALGGDDDAASELFSDETRAADDHAFYLKARDVIASILSGDKLQTILAGMKAAAGEPIEATEVEGVVEVMTERHNFTEGERKNVLGNLIKGADLSRWGLANAITRAAEDADTYDRASELEEIGGAMMLAPGSVPKPEAASRRKRRARSAAEVAASN